MFTMVVIYRVFIVAVQNHILKQKKYYNGTAMAAGEQGNSILCVKFNIVRSSLNKHLCKSC